MLRPRRRITRREIKEDALVTFYVKVQKFFQKHTRQLNIGMIVALVVVVVSFMMIRSKKSAENTADARMGVAEQFYYATDYTRAIQELDQIVNLYAGTNAAGRAVFFIANSYFAIGDIPNAEKYFRMYLDDYSKDALFIVSSMAGIAACLEYQDQFLQAAQMYEKAWNRQPDSFDAPFHLKDAGRCYIAAGSKEKGKEMYRLILDKYPESSINQDVSFLISTLSP
ncbi:MAG: tetratricopeptide repeat protein [bacterium]